MPGVCAIVCVRNEVRYLVRLLPYLRDQGVDVVLIDNESSDGSRELAESYLGAPVLRIERLGFDGAFDLTKQLSIKHRIVESLRHDWIMHQDADEILESRDDGATLLEAVAEAAKDGISLFDFDEFVFVPQTADGYPGDDYLKNARSYYFFQPRPSRLHRLFRRSDFASWGESGGHEIVANKPIGIRGANVLRHYIVLSVEHARQKYGSRRFARGDLQKGWHHNRLNVRPEACDYTVHLPSMHVLPSESSRDFDRSEPRLKHYWEA